MEKALKISLANLALLILLFGLLLRLNINASSSANSGFKSVDSRLAGFQEDMADLRLETSNIKQSMNDALIPLKESILKTESQSKQIIGLAEQVEKITEETGSLTGLKDAVRKLSMSREDLSVVVQEAVPAVVSIRTDTYQATGFFVDPRGYIVTNAHILTGNTFIRIDTFKHEKYSAELVGIDTMSDIALLKVKGNDFPTLEFGSSDDVSAGDSVVAIGNPGGFDFSVSKGVISSTERENKYKIPLFQMDISINPGNSGGPLIDARGMVIGMNSGFTSNVITLERLGFAIKSNFIQKTINNWISSN